MEMIAYRIFNYSCDAPEVPDLKIFNYSKTGTGTGTGTGTAKKIFKKILKIT